MKFPEDAEVRLYLRREREAGPVEEIPLAGDADVRTSASGDFELQLNRSEQEIRPLLRRKREPDVYLERLELRLSAHEFASISLHPSIDIDARYRLYQHGYQSWTNTGLRQHTESDEYVRLKWKHAMDENFETPHQGALPAGALPIYAFAAAGKFHSEHLVGLEQIEAPGAPWRLLFAAGHPVHHHLKFRVILDPHSGRLKEFAAIWDFNGRLFESHARESLTPLVWDYSDPARSQSAGGFENFLDAGVAKLAGKFPRPRFEGSMIGWCSWYYYYTKISESIILENLRQIQHKELRMDLFQIDDGWQRAIGDWTTVNEKFPSGMAFLAREIKKTGMRAGIWLAPFLAREESNLFREYPEMILRQPHSDKPVPALYNPLWGGWTYALDASHPRFKAWLSHVIHTIVHEWGYDYLKLDFLYAACFRGQHAQMSATGARRYEEAMLLIRRVAGKKTFILGCGAPMWSSVGLFDGMRIGMDVNHIWDGDMMSAVLNDRNYPTARGSLINTLTRSFMHRRFWLNDPDCLMVRGRNTKLTEKQVYLLASVMAISGGMLLLSDDLTILEPERLEIWKRAVSVNRKCAYYTPLPLGLLEHRFPRGLYNPAGYIGFWNPTHGPERVEAPLPPGLDESALRGARNLWTDEEPLWTVENRRVALSLAPFESVLVQLP